MSGRDFKQPEFANRGYGDTCQAGYSGDHVWRWGSWEVKVLHDIEQKVPVLTHRLYPELSEADLQLPELFDFAPTERHQTESHSTDASR